MTANEALVYCLGFRGDLVSDGEQHSQTVYDCNGEPHWVAWPADTATGPRLCSASLYPFAESLGPYRMFKEISREQ